VGSGRNLVMWLRGLSRAATTAAALVVGMLVVAAALPAPAALAKKPSSGAQTTSTVTAAATSTVPVAPVGAGSNPLSPGVPISPSEIPTTTTTTPQIVTTAPTSGSSGLSGGTALAIAIGAIVVLVGISLFIWRDARRRAPTRQRSAAATAGGRTGSKPRTKPRKLSPAERRRRKRGRAK